MTYHCAEGTNKVHGSCDHILAEVRIVRVEKKLTLSSQEFKNCDDNFSGFFILSQESFPGILIVNVTFDFLIQLYLLPFAFLFALHSAVLQCCP